MAKDFDITFQIAGIDALNAKLEGLIYDVRKKGGRFALRKAAQVVVGAAQRNAYLLDDPKTARNISTNIMERWNGKLNTSTGDLGFRIGVKGGARFSGKNNPVVDADGAPTPEWRALELGTETTPATPFFAKALQANIDGATNVFVSQYSAAIDRAIARAAQGGS